MNMYAEVVSQERRRSLNHLNVAEKNRPRSASTGMIEVSPFSQNFGLGQRSPATPCFVSPRMAFSTQFDFDSPIQVLTSRSPCVFKPMAVPSLSGKYSLKNLSHRCKIVLSILLLTIAGCLYAFCNFNGSKSNVESHVCADEICGAFPSSNQEFLDNISMDKEYLQRDFEDYINEMPYPNSGDSRNDPDMYSMKVSTHAGSVVKERGPIKVYGKGIDQEYNNLGTDQFHEHRTNDEIYVEGHKEQFLVIENEKLELDFSSRVARSTPFNGNPTEPLVGFQPLHNGEPLRNVPILSEEEILSRMTKHNLLQYKERSDSTSGPGFHAHSYDEVYRSDSRFKEQGNRPKRNPGVLRMDRLPPGINPRKYKTEF